MSKPQYFVVRMVRLSVEQVKEAAGFTNPLKEMELDLRSSRIDKLENLGLPLNQYDTLDLTDNFLRSLSYASKAKVHSRSQ